MVPQTVAINFKKIIRPPSFFHFNYEERHFSLGEQYGLKEGMYSGRIQNVIKMDDLFSTISNASEETIGKSLATLDGFKAFLETKEDISPNFINMVLIHIENKDVGHYKSMGYGL